MLKKVIKEILQTSKKYGWVLEPEAKRLLAEAGLKVPEFRWAKNGEEALQFAEKNGYPVVAKIVSGEVIHKSDRGGVIVGINSKTKLEAAFQHLSRLPGFEGIVVEEMLDGVELIAGAKLDYQFGPVILLGMGGTDVEIYKDTSLRMAPIQERDVISMVTGLKAYPLLKGYRGSKPINFQDLARTLTLFSELVMTIEEHIESIDLNPILCSAEQCVVADARIMLHGTDVIK